MLGSNHDEKFHQQKEANSRLPFLLILGWFCNFPTSLITRGSMGRYLQPTEAAQVVQPLQDDISICIIHNHCCISQLGVTSMQEQHEEHWNFYNLFIHYHAGGCTWGTSKVQTGRDAWEQVSQGKHTFTATETCTAGWLQSSLTETLQSFVSDLIQPNLSPHWAALNMSWETPQMLPVRGSEQDEAERCKKADKKYKSRQNKENPFCCLWRKSTQKREQPWLNLGSKGQVSRLVEAFDLYRNIKMSRRLKIELCFREYSHRLGESVHQDAIYMVYPYNGMVNPCNLQLLYCSESRDVKQASLGWTRVVWLRSLHAHLALAGFWWAPPQRDAQ